MLIRNILGLYSLWNSWIEFWIDECTSFGKVKQFYFLIIVFFFFFFFSFYFYCSCIYWVSMYSRIIVPVSGSGSTVHWILYMIFMSSAIFSCRIENYKITITLLSFHVRVHSRSFILIPHILLHIFFSFSFHGNLFWHDFPLWVSQCYPKCDHRLFIDFHIHIE